MPEIQSLVKQSFQTNTSWDYTQKYMNSKMLFMVKEETFDRASSRITELDTQIGAKRKVEGENSYRLGSATGYSKEIFRNTISVERDISWEAWEGYTVKGLADFVSNVRKDLDYKIYLDMTNVLSFCNSSSFTDNNNFTIDISGADTLAPIANHTLKYSATTYNNQLSNNPSFGQTAYENADNYFNYNVYDNFGKRLSSTPTHLITSYNRKMCNRVSSVLGSTSGSLFYGADGTTSSNTGNAGIENPIKDDIKHIKLQFDIDNDGNTDPTKSFWWFMAELRGDMRSTLQWYFSYWRRPTINPMQRNYSALSFSFTGYAAYSVGTVSSKRIVASFATS